MTLGCRPQWGPGTGYLVNKSKHSVGSFLYISPGVISENLSCFRTGCKYTSNTMGVGFVGMTLSKASAVSLPYTCRDASL